MFEISLIIFLFSKNKILLFLKSVVIIKLLISNKLRKNPFKFKVKISSKFKLKFIILFSLLHVKIEKFFN